MSKDKTKVIERLRNRIKPENRIFAQKNMAISQQVADLLNLKGWSQKEFAQKLDKRESEVSKWLSGSHNITMKSIAKMEAVLESEIITTPREACSKYKTIEYVTLKVSARSNQKRETISFKKKPELQTFFNTSRAITKVS